LQGKADLSYTLIQPTTLVISYPQAQELPHETGNNIIILIEYTTNKKEEISPTQQQQQIGDQRWERGY
jgi:hypothetical protein